MTETRDPHTEPPPSKLESFEPMPEASPPEKETFTSDRSGIEAAAAELSDHRSAEEPPVDRGYRNYATGERVPENQTLKLNRAADDLGRIRKIESQHQEALDIEATAQAVDQFRAEAFAQPEAAQAQPEQLQAQPTIEPQPEAPARDGADDDIVKVLQSNPKLFAAVQQQAQQVEAARAQYTQGLAQATTAALVTALTAFPELKSVQNLDQLQGALQTMALVQPERAKAAVEHLRRADDLASTYQRAAAEQQTRQQQQQQAQLNQWQAAQDSEFDSFAKSEPDLRRIQSELPRLAKEHFGIEPDALRHAWNNEPAFRSAPFQKALMFAAKHLLAQEGIQRAPRPVPPVQRPGVSGSFDDADASGVRSASREFSSELSPRAGAKLLQARRAAAANRNR